MRDKVVLVVNLSPMPSPTTRTRLMDGGVFAVSASRSRAAVIGSLGVFARSSPGASGFDRDSRTLVNFRFLVSRVYDILSRRL